jgi:hypothetical protein
MSFNWNGGNRVGATKESLGSGQSKKLVAPTTNCQLAWSNPYHLMFTNKTANLKRM